MHFEKLQILEEILGSFYRSNDEHLFFCPYCKHHKRKLSINLSKNTYKCWVCDTSSRNIYTIIKRYGNYSQKQHWTSFDDHVEITDFDNLFKEDIIEEQEQRIKLPKEFVCLANKHNRLFSTQARKYLKRRNITTADIFKWKIGFCDTGEYRNRIIFPSFGLNGYCNYFIARAYTDDWLKYKNPPTSKNIIFNELMIDWDEPIVLVEGVFDTINAENSTPLLGSTLSTHSKLFRAILTHSKRIYMALDHDAEKKALNIINALISHGVEVYKIDTSDHEDVGEMTKEEFKKRKDAAIAFDSNSLLIQKILQI
jgi:DNA primase